MARIKDPEFSDSALDEEDEATLAAIEEGIKAADEGRLASEEKLREFIPQWISRCFTRKPR